MGIPRVESAASPSFPRESLDAAAAPANAVAQFGETIAQAAMDWERRSADLKRFTEVNDKATATARQLDDISQFEQADPDYNTLSSRFETQARDLIQTNAATIQDKEARAHYIAQANDAALNRVREVRAVQRQRQIGAGVATLDNSMAEISDRLAVADPAETVTLMAKARGLVDGANAAGLFASKDKAEDYFRSWNGDQQYAAMIHDGALDPAGTLVRLSEGDYKGIDPVKRQTGIEQILSHLRSQDGKEWPDNPDVYRQVDALVHTATPKVDESGLRAYFHPGGISEESLRYFEGQLAEARTKAASNDPNVANLAARHQQAEQLLKARIGVDGPFAVLYQLDQTTRQVYADALSDLTNSSRYFGGLEDPITAWHGHIEPTFLPKIKDAAQGYVKIHRPILVSKAAEIGRTADEARAKGRLDEWNSLIEQIQQVDDIAKAAGIEVKP